MTTLYLSGPMTGYPEHNFAAFREAAWLLRGAGFHVIDPSELGMVDGWRWADYMRRDLRVMLDADGLAYLDGWHTSQGATLEVHVAERLGMECKPVGEWQP